MDTLEFGAHTRDAAVEIVESLNGNLINNALINIIIGNCDGDSHKIFTYPIIDSFVFIDL